MKYKVRIPVVTYHCYIVDANDEEEAKDTLLEYNKTCSLRSQARIESTGLELKDDEPFSDPTCWKIETASPRAWKLTKFQKHTLKMLLDHAVWYPGASWSLRTHKGTFTALIDLSQMGLVTKFYNAEQKRVEYSLSARGVEFAK